MEQRGQKHGDVVVDHHEAATRDGWHLHLKRTIAPGRLRPGSRPVLIIPGYGMNSFIFGFHPRGTSMEKCLAEAGLEVWSANLRSQGRSRCGRETTPGPSLRAYAEHDVAALVDAVLKDTRTGAERVDLIGCSLGGSIAYAYLALAEQDPRVHAMIAVGAPLRWSDVHPVLRTAFASPWLAGRLVIKGTRQVMKFGAGMLRKHPGLLSIYMNADHVDLSAIPEMVNTVEDPHPRVNRDIAKWMIRGDLVLRGVNVTEALRGRTIGKPLLVIVSNRDGIVPESANLSVTEFWGGDDVEVLRVGDDDDWYAHADLFVGDDAPRKVFEPIASFLQSRS